MIFGIKQIIKMLFQQLILPVVYNACTAKPVIPGTVILADAHHDEIPFSMLAIKEELSRQQRKSQETREKIFQAAKKILQKKGYEELSIKNICEEAGVSNGSFYHHFKTKDDLLSYYIEEQPTINPDLLEIPENAGGVELVGLL